MTKNKYEKFFMEDIYPLKNDIYRIILSAVSDMYTAEELTQSVMEKAWKGLDSLREEGRSRQWLKAITRNEIRQYFRKKNKRDILYYENLSVEGVEEQTYLIEKDILTLLVNREAQSLLVRVLNSMEEKYRTVICMHLFSEFSLKEIAEMKKIGYGNVRVIYSRGLKKLRDTYLSMEEGGC